MISALPAAADHRRQRWIAWMLALLCVFTLFARYQFRYGPRPYLFYGDARTGLPASDAVTWNLHALNLVEGRGFGDYLKQFRSNNYVPPGHPAILGFFYYLFGPNPRAVGWGVALLGSLLPWLAYLWTREMFGRRAGLIAAVLAALHPPYVHIGFSLMSEPTTVFTAAVALWLGARLLRKPTRRAALAAGLAFGGSALVRPSALAFLWGMAIMLLLAPENTWRSRSALALLLALSALLPLGAWQLRNARAHGEPAAVYSSISARHAWTGAHPEYGPSFYSRSIWHETLWRDPRASELEMIRRLQKESREFIRADRVRYLMSCLWRMKVLTPEFMHREFNVRWSPGGWGRMHFMVLAALALGGLLSAPALRVRLRDGRGASERTGGFWAASLLMGLAFAWIGAGMYGASDRYRWPLEYILLPFAALFLDGLLRLARAPVIGPRAIESAWPPPSRPARLARALGGIALALLLLGYAGHLVIVQANPPRPEERAPGLSERRVRSAFEAAGLASELAEQGPGWIRYEQVLSEQMENYGAVTSLNGRLVAWWGRLRFVRSVETGELLSGYIILEPRPGDFGGARLSFERAADAPPMPYRFREGDVVTLIARIQYRPRPLETPDLVVYAALPGRFEPDRARRGAQEEEPTP